MNINEIIKENFEIVAILEGTIESTGQNGIKICKFIIF